MTKDLNFYIDAFGHLTTNNKNGVPAPHKPILLLSIINLIEAGIISNNQIILNEELKISFSCIWHQFVDTEHKYKCNIALPFYHMKSEPFWKLQPSCYYEEKSSYNTKDLQSCFDYAIIDKELFTLLQDASNAVKLRVLLITRYISQLYIAQIKTI